MGVSAVQQFVANLRQMWRRVSTGARDTGQSAGAYLERQRKVVSLRNEVRRVEAQRSELYNIMGRKVYALHRKDKVANKDLLRRCQEIDDFNTLIEAKQTQIEALLATPEELEVDIEDDTELPDDEEADADEPAEEQAAPQEQSEQPAEKEDAPPAEEKAAEQ